MADTTAAPAPAPATTTSKPTIVLVHGLWMTPKCWEEWIPYYEAKGYKVIAPGWPGVDDRTVEEIRADPKPMASGTIEKIIEKYTGIIKSLPEKPIIMGHSFGGLFTQILIDRGLGVAGVALAPAAPAGIFDLPFSTIKATLPILSNPFDYKSTVKFTEDEFHYCFGNHLTKEESKPLFERYAIPSVAHVLWQGALGGLKEAGPGFVEFDKKERAPLLLTAGTLDHVVPVSTVHKEYEAYIRKGKNPNAIVEYHLFEGKSHGIVNQKGWQDVADLALNFVESHIKKA